MREILMTFGIAVAATVVTVMVLDVLGAHGADYRKLTSKLYPTTGSGQ